MRLAASRTHAAHSFSRDTAAESGTSPTHPFMTLLQTWEPPMPVDCSFAGSNRYGEDHDKISMDRSSGGLVAGRSYICHGSKWPGHWRISASHEKPESLSLPRLPSSLLGLLSSLSPLPSSLLVSLLKRTSRPPQRAARLQLQREMQPWRSG